MPSFRMISATEVPESACLKRTRSALPKSSSFPSKKTTLSGNAKVKNTNIPDGSRNGGDDNPGHHKTRAHYGIRTATHKLIHYWKKDVWELFDLATDPHEQNNLLFPDSATAPEPVERLFAKLRAEIKELQSTYQDDGQYADPATWPRGGVGGISGLKSIGHKTVAQGIALSEARKQQ